MYREYEQSFTICHNRVAQDSMTWNILRLAAPSWSVQLFVSSDSVKHRLKKYKHNDININ